MNEPFNRADIPDPKRTRYINDSSSHESLQKAVNAARHDHILKFGKKAGEAALDQSEKIRNFVRPMRRSIRKEILLKMRKAVLDVGLSRKDYGRFYKSDKAHLKQWANHKIKMNPVANPRFKTNLHPFKSGTTMALLDVLADAKPTQTQEHEWNTMRNDPKRRAPNYAYTD